MDTMTEELIEFYHDITADEHRKSFIANATNRGRDRGRSANRRRLVDVKLCKRQLHKRNRRNDEVTSGTYYKDCFSIGAVAYARS